MTQHSLHEILAQSVDILKKGGVLLYPADTVWGIGCDATQPEAIEKVIEIKGRNNQKPFILLVSDISDIKKVARTIHPRVETLLSLHTRPLTIIYPEARKEFSHVANANGSIGIRVVNRGFCHDLIKQFGSPIISTSANFSGSPTPLRFGSIDSDIIQKVDFTVPAIFEKGLTGKPSQIASYDKHGELTFLR